MTGMMMSFSLPGLPSAFSLRMAFASSELCAIPRVTPAAAVNPRAERTEPNRTANVRRVDMRFILVLLSIYDLEFMRKDAGCVSVRPYGDPPRRCKIRSPRRSAETLQFRLERRVVITAKK